MRTVQTQLVQTHSTLEVQLPSILTNLEVQQHSTIAVQAQVPAQVSSHLETSMGHTMAATFMVQVIFYLMRTAVLYNSKFNFWEGYFV